VYHNVLYALKQTSFHLGQPFEFHSGAFSASHESPLNVPRLHIWARVDYKGNREENVIGTHGKNSENVRWEPLNTVFQFNVSRGSFPGVIRSECETDRSNTVPVFRMTGAIPIVE